MAVETDGRPVWIVYRTDKDIEKIKERSHIHYPGDSNKFNKEYRSYKKDYFVVFGGCPKGNELPYYYENEGFVCQSNCASFDMAGRPTNECAGAHPMDIPEHYFKDEKTVVIPTHQNAKQAKMGTWIPPENPNPREILNEARSDAHYGRYNEAMKKHIWFHENALKYDRSFYGVRLSFALGYWHELGNAYPPALEALKKARDAAESSVRSGTNFYDSFNDYESINKELNENNKTVELFLWLNKKHPDKARKVYQIAEPALIKAKEYKLCGKYIDPENAYLREVRHFHSLLAFSKEYKDPDTARDAYVSFANKVSILVAILVLNDRKSEAEETAEMALLEWDDEDFSALLDSALKGNVPTPWP